jgi:hypothetical protein
MNQLPRGERDTEQSRGEHTLSDLKNPTSRSDLIGCVPQPEWPGGGHWQLQGYPPHELVHQRALPHAGAAPHGLHHVLQEDVGVPGVADRLCVIETRVAMGVFGTVFLALKYT